MNRVLYLIPILAVVLVGAFLAGQFTSTEISGFGTVGIGGVIHGGASCAKVIRADGMVEDLGCEHNYFMDEGKLFIADQIDTTTADTDSIDVLFLGNGTSWNTNLATHTDEIFGCSLDGTSIDWTDVSGGTGNLSASHEWTMSGCSSIVVNTTGINCSACDASAEFFAANNFTQSVTLSDGDKLNVTWYVWSA